jgi:hypothetical protein
VALSDLATAVPILAAAIYLLVRSILRTKGGCHGCNAGGCGARPPAQGGLVRLGRPGRGPSAG